MPELRYSMCDKINTRTGDKDAIIIEGHAAVFDVETELWPGYFEVVRSSAFEETLSEGLELSSLYSTYNHTDSQILARTTNTLRVMTDATGLAFSYESPAGVTYAENLVRNILNGNVKGCSFAFHFRGPESVKVESRKEGGLLQELLSVRLIELGPVTNPQYPEAGLSMRDASRRFYDMYSEPKHKPSRQAQRRRELALLEVS